MNHYSKPETIINNEDYCLLIHRLLRDRRRLEQMVIKTREEVNAIATPGTDLFYDMTAENVFDRSYSEMPAFKQYEELFGEEALLD